MDELKPEAKGTPIDLHYDPQADSMRHDSVFAEHSPGIVTSGNLAHKWGAPEAHTRLSAPPSGLRGD
jgi:hypothetical protein